MNSSLEMLKIIAAILTVKMTVHDLSVRERLENVCDMPDSIDTLDTEYYRWSFG